MYLVIAFASVVLLIVFYFVVYFGVKRYRRLTCSLSGKVVLVTGSANGHGRVLCKYFIKEKCHVICVDIDKKTNAQTVEELKKLTDVDDLKIVAYTCDVADKAQVNYMAANVLNDFGRVDILVNNAGILHAGYITDFSEESIRKTMDINLMSHFWTIQAFLPQMLSRNSGCIVAISSVAGLVGFKHMIPYCASKFAVSGLMDSLQSELKYMKASVDTLCVHPIFMHTNMITEECVNDTFNSLPPENVARIIINGIKEKTRRLRIPAKYINIRLAEMRLFPSIFAADLNRRVNPLKHVKLCNNHTSISNGGLKKQN